MGGGTGAIFIIFTVVCMILLQENFVLADLKVDRGDCNTNDTNSFWGCGEGGYCLNRQCYCRDGFIPIDKECYAKGGLNPSSPNHAPGHCTTNETTGVHGCKEFGFCYKKQCYCKEGYTPTDNILHPCAGGSGNGVMWAVSPFVLLTVAIVEMYKNLH